MLGSRQNNLTVWEAIPHQHCLGTRVEESDVTCTQVVCISDDPTVSCCNDKYHRKLAIASIVCGFYCCGIPALVYSVKAEDAHKAENARVTTDNRAGKYLRQAKKWSIISIGTWIGLLILVPVMTALVSYLVTLIE